MFDYRKILRYFQDTFAVRDLFILGTIIIAYFVIRLINLEILPVFNDEGIYIDWAQTAAADPNWRFISLTDGKQPLQTWLTIPLLKMLPEHTIFAGRLMSVLTGFIALTGMFTLLLYVFNKRTAIIGSVLYVVTPYFLFYDRIAMIDSGVNAAFIWILFFTILMARTIRFDVALLFGIVGGIGLLAKSSVSMFLLLAAFAPVLFITKDKKYKKQIPMVLNYLILFGITFVISQVIYNIQRLSPFFYMIKQKNYTFISHPEELLKDPFMNVLSNLRDIPYFIAAEMGYTLALAGIIGFVMLFRSHKRFAIYAAISIVLPFVAITFFNKVLFPRYIIFFASWMLIFAAYFLSTIKDRRIFWGAIVAIVVPILYFNYTILFNPALLPFPQTDRGQYIEGWAAGWGARDIMNIARAETATRPVIILAEGDFGMSEDVLKILKKPTDTDIIIAGKWPLGKEQLEQEQINVGEKTVYAVFTHYQNAEAIPTDWPIELVEVYDKPGDESQVLLYRLLPAQE